METFITNFQDGGGDLPAKVHLDGMESRVSRP
jgi:hypothetical protein